MKFRGRQEESLDSEIRDYIERETELNIEAGMSAEEARHAALRKFGRPVLNVKEETRAVWGWVWLERLWQDLVHGRRMLMKNPGFTLVAVLSLAIGIGANSAMFSFADALLLRPMPITRPGEVVTVGTIETVAGFSAIVASYRDYTDFRDQSKSFTGLTALRNETFGFSTRADATPQMKLGMMVSGNFLRVMGINPELGRDFRDDEDKVPGRDAVLILDHNTWETDFSSDPEILGRRVRLDGIEFTIIGVTPARFTGPNRYFEPAFYIPMKMWPSFANSPKGSPLEQRDLRDLSLKGRLKPGVSEAQAQAEIAAIAKNLERAYPDTNRNRSGAVRTELEARIIQSPPDAVLVAMLSTLALAVLIVACANVAGLMASRAPVRAREIALRLAIGAGRPRLIRQLLTESLLLSLAGGALGLFVGYAGVIFFRQLQMPTDLPVKLTFEMNDRALVFSLLVACVSAVLFGLIPAFQTTRSDLVNSLKSSVANTSGGRRLWGRNLLVTAQVAITVVLLAVATFMFRGVRAELGKDPGFRVDHLLTMTFDPALVRYTDAQSQQFYKQLIERARQTPGVKSAALTFTVPFTNNADSNTIVPEGFRFPQGKESVNVLSNTVGDGYFDTAGIRILRGRGFQTTDTATSPKVAVVNEELAKHYWQNQDAVGKRFRLDGPNGPWVEVVGLAKTVKYLWIAEPPTEFLYLPFSQHPKGAMMLLTESAGDPLSLAAPLRDVVRSLDANLPIYDVRTYAKIYQMRAVSTSYLIVETVGAIGVMGLVLSMVGLYGLVAYSAGRRTREIGLRMAIGAQPGSVLRMVMHQAMALALVGLAVGLAASVGAERVLNGIFSGEGGIDLPTYLLVGPALLAITLFAAFVPARKASRIDPMTALRYE